MSVRVIVSYCGLCVVWRVMILVIDSSIMNVMLDWLVR